MSSKDHSHMAESVALAWPEGSPVLRRDEGGALRVAGTRVCLERVVGAHKQGCSPEEIVRKFPSLHREEVDAVITDYLHHQPEVEAYLGERRLEAEELRRQVEERFPPDGVRDRLLARQAPGSDS
jgi:uncharacterized protein (DUF433 family)